MQDKLLTVKDVRKRFNCATSTIYRWIKMGYFPRPLQIGGMVRWEEQDVERVVSQAKLSRAGDRIVPKGVPRRGRPVNSFNSDTNIPQKLPKPKQLN